jgi:hypothetical protein
MAIIRRILPYLILSALTIVLWRFETLTDKYAWNPQGKERAMLDISLNTIFAFKVIFWLIVGNGALYSFISYLRQKRTIAVTSGLLVVAIYFFGGHWLNRELASSYFSVFRNQSVVEEYMDRPIREAGYYIGPELTEYIQGKADERRLYAISGVGKIRYDPATPTLAAILSDVNEPDHTRAVAFGALKSIGSDAAEKIVREFETEGDKKVLDLVGERMKAQKNSP